LLLGANRPVPADRLVEELWAGRPPAGAAKTLRSYVSRLRAVLGGGAIHSRAPGYLLEVEPDKVDARRFERLLGEGLEAHARGAAEEAAAILREGLALWRGGALADLVDEPFAGVEPARLEELRLVALETRIEADLASGRHRALVAELEALIAREPLRERLWGQLMIALYRSGRQADALAAYRRARGLLEGQLGLDTGEELHVLEQKILRHELHLVSEARVQTPPPTNLPVQLTSFVGREREHPELAGMIPATRLITLTGVGGCGKTRLALEAAGDVLPHFRDGVHLVELAGLTQSDLVADAVASALGVHERGERPPLELLVDHLRPQALLLVLDNCEHLLDGCAELAAALLSACPELRILATSREPLGIPGERVYRVPPLALTDRTGENAGVAESEAARLFVERASAAGWEQDTSPAAMATIDSICRELDGLPLALELAAARTEVLTVQEISDRLDDRFRFLRSSRRREPRHETLGATMAWSYELLTEDERALLRGLSVFVGGFTLDAAAAVCLEDDAEATLELLTRLVRASLVLQGATEGATRYRMLETVRHYAAGRLAETDEADALRGRHAAYFSGDPEDALRFWPPVAFGGTLSLRTNVELDNMRAALDWAQKTKSPLELPLAILYQRADAVFPAEGRARLERALAGPSAQPAELRARALAAAGGLARLQGDETYASRYLEESVRLYRAAGDERCELVALSRLEEVALATGADHRRLDLGEDAEALARRVGDPVALSAALTRRAVRALTEGHRSEARGLLDESLVLFDGARGRVKELDSAYPEADTRTALAILELLDGNLSDAVAEVEVGLAAFSEGSWDSVDVLAAVVAHAGNLETAVRLNAAATGSRERRGEQTPWVLAAVREQTHARLEHALTLPEFAAAAAEGRRMNLGEATSTALEAGRRLVRPGQRAQRAPR
jgi:predicted ATPase/DNA-binding SARP family transcriptional activator